MRIGVGLPNPVPGMPGDRFVEWARRAEERGFAGLVTIDRIAYPSHDSLTTHAAVAGATSRIGLMTNILLAPIYPSVVLAKAAASIDQISRGRFTLGMAPGARSDDFTVTNRDFRSRGADLDATLDLMHRAWRGEPISEDRAVVPTPVHAGRVPVMIGGYGEKAVQRCVRWGVGWTAGGMPPDTAGRLARRVREEWRQAGRQEQPRLAALTYYSLGPEAEDDSRGYLRDYYAYVGASAEQIAEAAPRSATAVRDTVRAYRDEGFTELYFDPTVTRVDQVDRLADAVL